MRKLLVILLTLLVVPSAFGATTSTKFSSNSIPEVGDAGTGWGTNLRAWALSVDEELIDSTPDSSTVANTLTITGAVDANGTSDFDGTATFDDVVIDATLDQNGTADFATTLTFDGGIIETDGDFGIGTASPASRLNIVAKPFTPVTFYLDATAANQYSYFSARNTADGTQSGFVMYGSTSAGTSFGRNKAGLSVFGTNNDAQITGFALGTLTADDVVIGTTNAERVTIHADGDVGIGDITPDAQLDIVNDTAADIGIIVQGASSQSANLQEWQDSSSNKLAYVEADGDLYVTDHNSGWGLLSPPSYASIYATNATVTINTVDTDTLASAGATLGATNGPSYNTTTGIITIQSGGGGTYMVGWSMSLSGGNNDTVTYTLYHNGSAEGGFQTQRKLSAAGDVGNAGIDAPLALAAADTLKLMTQQDTTTTNQTIFNGNWYIRRIE